MQVHVNNKKMAELTVLVLAFCQPNYRKNSASLIDLTRNLPKSFKMIKIIFQNKILTSVVIHSELHPKYMLCIRVFCICKVSFPAYSHYHQVSKLTES